MLNKFSNNTSNDKSLLEILNILYRRKIVILLSAFVCLILAFLYNQFSKPIFESKAILKKEATNRGPREDEIYELINLQTSDQIDTEIEIIKTEEVLGRVIEELNLRIKLNKITDSKGESYELNNIFVDFPESGNVYVPQIHFSLPIFNNVELKDDQIEIELFIEKKDKELFELREAHENDIMLVCSLENLQINEIDTTDSLNLNIPIVEEVKRAIFETEFADFEFAWDDAPIGSRVYFEISNHYKYLEELSKNINVGRVRHSNMFELSVSSTSPFASKVIAELVIDSFRKARMEQQKQAVRYSFQFIDEQLTEVQIKLLNAEKNLSNFKGSGQIMTIDASTEEIMNYVSTLEAEKLQTELLLSNYKDKAEAMRKELESSGYFDQSFLEPSGEYAGDSPFSTLITHLADLEMQKLELLQKRTEKHPDVVNLNEKIALVRDKLSSYNQNTLTSYRIIIETLEKKLVKILSFMSGYENQMMALPEQENKMARLVREKDVYEKMFKLLLDKREEMRVAELSQLQDIIVIDSPHLPFKPIRPRKLFNMVVALFLGGFIGIVFIFFIELKNSRLVSLDYLEEEFRIPVLALIPKYSKNIVRKMKKQANIEDRFAALKGDNSGIRESYRLLETKLQQLYIRDKIILVTSCEENAGKTNIVANLAITMAQNSRNILIIDCDLRKAELSKMFDVFDSPGLIDFINKGGTPAIYNKVLKQLNIIPAGGVTENSGLLLSSERMKSLFNSIDTSIYDYIIIDTPPVTRVVDTLALGQFIKNTILVVRPDISIKETVIGGIQEMNHARIKIRGIVGNSVEIQKSYHYKYRYGYGYGYSKGDNGRSPVAKKRGLRIRKAAKMDSA